MIKVIWYRHPIKHQPLKLLLIVATQTPLLITLLALTASQIDRTEELRTSAKQARSCKPNKSRTLTTTTITDIPTLPTSSVQTSSFTRQTATQNSTANNTTTRRRSQARSEALAHLICITLMDILNNVEASAKTYRYIIQEYRTKLHLIVCNPVMDPNGDSILRNCLYYSENLIVVLQKKTPNTLLLTTNFRLT